MFSLLCISWHFTEQVYHACAFVVNWPFGKSVRVRYSVISFHCSPEGGREEKKAYIPPHLSCHCCSWLGQVWEILCCRVISNAKLVVVRIVFMHVRLHMCRHQFLSRMIHLFARRQYSYTQWRGRTHSSFTHTLLPKILIFPSFAMTERFFFQTVMWESPNKQK